MMPRPEGDLPGSLMPGAPGAQLPGADPFHLLMNSTEVQAELGLTKLQLAGLEKAARNFHTQLAALLAPRPGVSPEQAQADLQAHVESARGMVARELRPQQLARLHQIMLQLEGPCLAAIDPQARMQLRITPEQAARIDQACRARAMQMRDAFRPPGNGADFCAMIAANRERIEKVRSAADQRIAAILSPQQNAAFEHMVGKRISLEPPQPPQCR
jgi:hypothetical protein